MKARFFLFCWLFIISFTALGQYQKLLVPNKKWNYVRSNNSTWCIGELYALQHDTLINGQQFFNVYYFQSQLPIPSGIYLREDTLEKKVYHYSLSPNDSLEYLLYDFSLQQADTVLEIDSTLFIDSVFYQNIEGISRKVLQIRDFQDPQIGGYWIEGIGDTNCLFCDIRDSPICIYTLQCVIRDHELLYENKSGSCTIQNFSVAETTSEIKFSMYPNPTPNVFTVDLGGTYEKVEIAVYSISGEEILRVKSKSAAKIIINLSGKKSGNYLVSVFIDNKEIQNEQLIKVE